MLTTYFKNLVANHLWHPGSACTVPTQYYLALSSTQPKNDGTGVKEPTSASGYARIETTGLSQAQDGEVVNEAPLRFPRIDTAQGTIAYWALYDAKTGGNLLLGGALDAAKTLDAGTTIEFAAGDLHITILGE